MFKQYEIQTDKQNIRTSLETMLNLKQFHSAQ